MIEQVCVMMNSGQADIMGVTEGNMTDIQRQKKNEGG